MGFILFYVFGYDIGGLGVFVYCMVLYGIMLCRLCVMFGLYVVLFVFY